MRTQQQIQHAFACFLVVCAVGLAPERAAAQIEFDPPAVYEVGLVPTSVTSADFDGDGSLDLAVTNEGSGTVTLLFNDGKGGFATTDSFETGFDTAPFALAAGDFDDDGDNDLVVVIKDQDSISLYFNDGNGGFVWNATFPVGDTPRSIVVGDLNHDEQPDIAVANKESSDVSVFLNLNLGDGTFGPAATYPAGDDLRQIVIGLLNDDEHPDLAVTSHDSNSIEILLNTGAGDFILGTPVDLGQADRPDALAIGDLDGDGDQDLAVGLEGDLFGSIRILENMGNAEFSPLTSLPASNDVAALQIGDLNADGVLDVASADREAVAVLTYENLGGGVFGVPGIVTLDPNPYYMQVGDFSGNGLCDDIAIPNNNEQDPKATGLLTVLISQAIAACQTDLSGDGEVGPTDLAQLLASWGPCEGCPADFNGDGSVGPVDLAQLLATWGACP